MDTTGLDLRFRQPDEEGIIKFLCEEKSFNEERVRRQLAKLKAAKAKSSQNRLESFFGATTVVSSTIGKRKEPEGKGKGKGSKAALGTAGKKSKGVGKKK